jgi:hypothetical protein
MSTEFFRKYIDIMDEAVRGVMVGPGGTAIRPTSPEERDMVAKGLKTARTYNKNMAKYAAAPGEKQDVDPATAQRRSRGALSGSIIEPSADGTGADVEKGMPVTIPSAPDSGTWQTRAINTKNPNVKVGSDIKANQGKATGPRKPSAPF